MGDEASLMAARLLRHRGQSGRGKQSFFVSILRMNPLASLDILQVIQSWYFCVVGKYRM